MRVLVGYLGLLEGKNAINSGPMVFRGKTLAGSLIGGLAETQELLDFCGENGVVSDIEIINIQDINTAYQRVLKSDVQYRFVIDLTSLKNGSGHPGS